MIGVWFKLVALVLLLGAFLQKSLEAKPLLSDNLVMLNRSEPSSKSFSPLTSREISFDLAGYLSRLVSSYMGFFLADDSSHGKFDLHQIRTGTPNTTKAYTSIVENTTKTETPESTWKPTPMKTSTINIRASSPTLHGSEDIDSRKWSRPQPLVTTVNMVRLHSNAYEQNTKANSEILDFSKTSRLQPPVTAETVSGSPLYEYGSTKSAETLHLGKWRRYQYNITESSMISRPYKESRHKPAVNPDTIRVLHRRSNAYEYDTTESYGIFDSNERRRSQPPDSRETAPSFHSHAYKYTTTQASKMLDRNKTIRPQTPITTATMPDSHSYAHEYNATEVSLILESAKWKCYDPELNTENTPRSHSYAYENITTNSPVTLEKPLVTEQSAPRLHFKAFEDYNTTEFSTQSPSNSSIPSNEKNLSTIEKLKKNRSESALNVDTKRRLNLYAYEYNITNSSEIIGQAEKSRRKPLVSVDNAPRLHLHAYEYNDTIIPTSKSPSTVSISSSEDNLSTTEVFKGNRSESPLNMDIEPRLNLYAYEYNITNSSEIIGQAEKSRRKPLGSIDNAPRLHLYAYEYNDTIIPTSKSPSTVSISSSEDNLSTTEVFRGNRSESELNVDTKPRLNLYAYEYNTTKSSEIIAQAEKSRRKPLGSIDNAPRLHLYAYEYNDTSIPTSKSPSEVSISSSEDNLSTTEVFKGNRPESALNVDTKPRLNLYAYEYNTTKSSEIIAQAEKSRRKPLGSIDNAPRLHLYAYEYNDTSIPTSKSPSTVSISSSEDNLSTTEVFKGNRSESALNVDTKPRLNLYAYEYNTTKSSEIIAQAEKSRRKPLGSIDNAPRLHLYAYEYNDTIIPTSKSPSEVSISSSEDNLSTTEVFKGNRPESALNVDTKPRLNLYAYEYNTTKSSEIIAQAEKSRRKPLGSIDNAPRLHLYAYEYNDTIIPTSKSPSTVSISSSEDNLSTTEVFKGNRSESALNVDTKPRLNLYAYEYNTTKSSEIIAQAEKSRRKPLGSIDNAPRLHLYAYEYNDTIIPTSKSPSTVSISSSEDNLSTTEVFKGNRSESALNVDTKPRLNLYAYEYNTTKTSEIIAQAEKSRRKPLGSIDNAPRLHLYAYEYNDTIIPTSKSPSTVSISSSEDNLSTTEVFKGNRSESALNVDTKPRLNLYAYEYNTTKTSEIIAQAEKSRRKPLGSIDNAPRLHLYAYEYNDTIIPTSKSPSTVSISSSEDNLSTTEVFKGNRSESALNVDTKPRLNLYAYEYNTTKSSEIIAQAEKSRRKPLGSIDNAPRLHLYAYEYNDTIIPTSKSPSTVSISSSEDNLSTTEVFKGNRSESALNVDTKPRLNLYAYEYNTTKTSEIIAQAEKSRRKPLGSIDNAPRLHLYAYEYNDTIIPTSKSPSTVSISSSEDNLSTTEVFKGNRSESALNVDTKPRLNLYAYEYNTTKSSEIIAQAEKSRRKPLGSIDNAPRLHLYAYEYNDTIIPTSKSPSTVSISSSEDNLSTTEVFKGNRSESALNVDTKPRLNLYAYEYNTTKTSEIIAQAEKSRRKPLGSIDNAPRLHLYAYEYNDTIIPTSKSPSTVSISSSEDNLSTTEVFKGNRSESALNVDTKPRLNLYAYDYNTTKSSEIIAQAEKSRRKPLGSIDNAPRLHLYAYEYNDTIIPTSKSPSTVSISSSEDNLSTTEVFKGNRSESALNVDTKPRLNLYAYDYNTTKSSEIIAQAEKSRRKPLGSIDNAPRLHLYAYEYNDTIIPTSKSPSTVSISSSEDNLSTTEVFKGNRSESPLNVDTEPRLNLYAYEYNITNSSEIIGKAEKSRRKPLVSIDNAPRLHLYAYEYNDTSTPTSKSPSAVSISSSEENHSTTEVFKGNRSESGLNVDTKPPLNLYAYEYNTTKTVSISSSDENLLTTEISKMTRSESALNVDTKPRLNLYAYEYNTTKSSDIMEEGKKIVLSH